MSEEKKTNFFAKCSNGRHLQRHAWHFSNIRFRSSDVQIFLTTQHCNFCWYAGNYENSFSLFLEWKSLVKKIRGRLSSDKQLNLINFKVKSWWMKQPLARYHEWKLLEFKWVNVYKHIWTSYQYLCLGFNLPLHCKNWLCFFNEKKNSA